MSLPFSLDRGAGSRARLGLVVLETDETLETEIRPCLAPEVALYHSRIPCQAEVNEAGLAKMEADLPFAAGLIPPGFGLSSIGYACTSGATVIGPEKITAIVQQKHPTAQVTNPITAVIAGLRKLDCRKIGFITPYVEAVSARMRALLQAEGFEISAFASFAQGEECTVARIQEADTLRALLDMDSTHCDAIFVSCTNLRTFTILSEAEKQLGKPVISSNQALIWHMLRQSGIGASEPAGRLGPGRLFQA